MKLIERRLGELRIEPLNIEQVSTRYSGDIFLIHTKDERYVYKQFYADNEEYIKCKAIGSLKGIIPIVHLWEDGLLMIDCGISMKYRGLSQIEVIEIFKTLLDMQNVKVELPVFRLDEIEREWLFNQCSRLQDLDINNALDKINDYYEKIDVKHYQSVLPRVLAHGDSHLDNIFKTNHHIKLIDWERASLSSPVHDATMLIQDIGDKEWFLFYRDTFYKLLAMNYLIEEKQFRKEFNVFLLVNTVKMIVWEISKFEQGWQDKKELLEKIRKKVQILSISLFKD